MSKGERHKKLKEGEAMEEKKKSHSRKVMMSASEGA